MEMNFLAVHIADGIPLSWPWLGGGFAVAAALIALSCFRITDAEIPSTALITAALFVASSIHLRVGPTSVHLVFNGLAGVLLGRRVGAAIAVALVMQAMLLSHGGFSTLGINICILTLPALAAGLAYRSIFASSLWTHPGARSVLAFTAAALWLAACVIGIGKAIPPVTDLVRSPLTWCIVGLLSATGVWVERKLESDPTFAIGLLLGVATTLLTIALNAFVLRIALPSESEPIAGIVFLAHMPVAAIEGVVLGAALSMLRRSAPQLLPRSFRGGIGPRE